jgi:hypothetical protein
MGSSSRARLAMEIGEGEKAPASDTIPLAGVAVKRKKYLAFLYEMAGAWAGNSRWAELDAGPCRTI